MEKEDLLIVGLGNPGKEYEDTRHNVGFIVIDGLLHRWSGPDYREKWNGFYVSLTVQRVKVHMLKPLTYMNRSGQSVRKFYQFFKVKPSKLLVVHDDLDMAFGRVKLVKGGGTGGHKGIASIAENLGTKDFHRLKIGIGRPGQGEVHRDFPVEKYVLSSFSDEELQLLQSRQPEVEKGVGFFIDGDHARAMGILNSLK